MQCKSIDKVTRRNETSTKTNTTPKNDKFNKILTVFPALLRVHEIIGQGK